MDAKTLFHRQKVLLALLESFGGKLPSTDFQKYLFLYTRLCEKKHSYDFVPYKFGCFSFQSYADKTKLIDKSYLEDSQDWKLTTSNRRYVDLLTRDERQKLVHFREKYAALKGKKLLRHVYRNYPYYAINSIVADDILDAEGLKAVKAYKVRRRVPLFATIGYEGLSIEAYINRLIENDVRLLVDVRKNPISRKFGFSKSRLKDLLTKVGIGYQHMPELGIVSDKRKNLKADKDYKILFADYEETVLKNNVAALKSLTDFYKVNGRIAITCFEECHTHCHRHKITDFLSSGTENNFKVTHL